MSEICFILAGFTALVGACLVLDRAKNLQDVKIPIFLTIEVCTILLVAGIILAWCRQIS
jgi:uncharacterized membrane protein